MTAPLIGVTAGRRPSRGGYSLVTVVEAYIQALLHAGANPLIIPLGQPEAALAGLPARLDGILFTGGGDIHPDRYRSQMHPQVYEVDEDRDRVELQLVQSSVQAGLPFLGICRGLQVVNVGLGGSLYEDIQDQRPESIPHRYWPGWPRDYLAHGMDVAAGSRLAEITAGEEFMVNSLHHQGIRDLAPALSATAHAPDGLIEAVELPDYPFGLAVQWHPEWMPGSKPMQALFAAFVSAAQQRRTGSIPAEAAAGGRQPA